MVQAIIFDCFGVLATEAWLPFKAKYFGHDPELYRQASDIVSQANGGLISYDEFMQQIGDLAGVKPAAVHQALIKNVPNEPLFAYIRELKTHYKIGFLSNIAGNRLDQIFTADQLELLDVIALSFETGYVKPQAQAYYDVADQLGVSVNECVFVDDQERQVSGALEVGMQAILYQDFAQFKTDLSKILKA